MQITHQEFKDANARLLEQITYPVLLKAIKKPLYDYFETSAGKAVVDDLEVYLGELEKQTPDKRLTAQWLSTALAGKDYNQFIAELKSQDEAEKATSVAKSNTTEENAPFSYLADKIDFESFEQALIQFVEARHENRVLYSELEIFGTAITIMDMLFGRTQWSKAQTFKMIYNQASASQKIRDDEMVYWIQAVEVSNDEYVNSRDYMIEYVIAYEYKAGKEANCEPSEMEVEQKQLERYTTSELKRQFAWNCKTNKPVLISKGGHRILLVNE